MSQLDTATAIEGRGIRLKGQPKAVCLPTLAELPPACSLFVCEYLAKVQELGLSTRIVNAVIVRDDQSLAVRQDCHALNLLQSQAVVGSEVGENIPHQGLLQQRERPALRLWRELLDREGATLRALAGLSSFPRRRESSSPGPPLSRG
jgi:hypothetical protein